MIMCVISILNLNKKVSEHAKAIKNRHNHNTVNHRGSIKSEILTNNNNNIVNNNNINNINLRASIRSVEV